MKSDRRRFLKTGSVIAGFFAFSQPWIKAFAAACGLTPPQTPGPFYPGEDKFRPEHDLTRIRDRGARALGQIVYVKGKVVDSQCRPIKDANVEIWQACATGRYNNPKDPNPA